MACRQSYMLVCRMGALRLFLAISVVIAHTGPLFGLQLMPSFEAVRIFFAISGFYMALVLKEKYAGRTLLFYSNRALRIYPTYWLALAVTLPLIGRWPLQGLEGLSWLGALFANLSLFGADVLYFTRHGPRLAVDPAWSLGAELLFYLAAPFIARLGTWWLGGIAAVSFGLQLALDHFHPWTSYYLFPTNLCFFVYGMLAFRFMGTGLFAVLRARLGWPIAAGALLALMGREFVPLFRNYSWMHYVVAFGALPFIFSQFKRLAWDRWIGELSYPVYILHFAAINAAIRFFGGPSLWWTLAMTLPASVAVVLWFEGPIDRWRARRAEAGNPAANLHDRNLAKAT
ncbi:MAG: acyltransferase [Phenylobacterium sp.]|nr:MAG: acyltransferase [Phenylobacterium sp.]